MCDKQGSSAVCAVGINAFQSKVRNNGVSTASVIDVFDIVQFVRIGAVQAE
jgi:hypothetical protein